jgi:hypothetical protein
LAFGAQPVGRLVTRDAELIEVDEHVQQIEVMAGLLVQQLVIEYVEPGDAIDAPACPSRELERPAQQIVSVLNHLTTPTSIAA